ncbi:hypothetical protein RTP6_004421 [Batrachochytrium dendrobatidis]
MMQDVLPNLPEVSMDNSYLPDILATQSKASIPLPHIEQDDTLQKHYARVQKTLFDSVDKRVLEIESELRETRLNLKHTNEDKINMGQALYLAKSEVTKFNSALASTRLALHQAQNEQKTISKLQSVTETDIQNVAKTNKLLQRELENTKSELEQSTTKIHQLQEINANYTSDIKIQRRIQNKLKKEFEFSELKRKQAEEIVENEKRLLEQAALKQQELASTIDVQKSEALVAQKAIDGMHREINILTSTKEATEKQWSEAITAMSKRDTAFQAINESKQTLSSQYLEAQNTIRVLKLERNEALQKLSEKKTDYENIEKTLEDLRTLHKGTVEQLIQTRNELVQIESAETAFKNEVNKLKKTKEDQSAEVDKKTTVISNLKSKISQLKSDFDEKMRLHVPVNQAFHREEQIKQQALSEIKSITRDEETKSINLRRQNAQLQMKVNDTSEKMLHITQERNLVKEQYEDISAHYAKLYEETKYLIYALERREHDLNFLKGKMNQKEIDNTGAFNIIMGKLQKKLDESIKEKDRLQQLWLESQKDALKAKEQVTKLQNENSFLQTKLRIDHTVKTKTNAELDESKAKTLEHNMEAMKLYNELRRIQPVMEDLQKKNKAMEKQLREAQLKLEEADINSTTSKQMLQAEIRRLYQDRQGLKKANAESAQVSMNIERKTELFQEIVDKLKSERYELQRANYTLNRKAAEMERKYFDAKLQTRRANEKQQVHQQTIRRQSLSKQSVNSHITNSAPWESIMSLSQASLPSVLSPPGTITDESDGLSKAMPDTQGSIREITKVPDFEAWRLRIDSLEKEKQHLLNENKRIQDQINDQANRIAKSESRLLAEETRQKMDDAHHRELEKNIDNLNKRCQRAEKIAAHMEQQIKEAKPNLKIDYQMLGECEPSTQLLAALLTWDSTPRAVKS